MGALLYVDTRLGTSHTPFTTPGGLYQRWVDAVLHEPDRPAHTPDRELATMTRLRDFADGWTTPG